MDEVVVAVDVILVAVILVAFTVLSEVALQVQHLVEIVRVASLLVPGSHACHAGEHDSTGI